MFADYDGRAADAEHQRQQRPHTKVVYVSLHGRHAQFAMPAMCGASAVEMTQRLIHSHYSGDISGKTPSFNTGIFAFYFSGNCLGALKVY